MSNLKTNICSVPERDMTVAEQASSELHDSIEKLEGVSMELRNRLTPVSSISEKSAPTLEQASPRNGTSNVYTSFHEARDKIDTIANQLRSAISQLEI